MLQHARQVARQHATQQGQKYKENFDKTAASHKFKIDQKVWLSDTTALGKNPKLTPKWLGPYKIVDLNENNGKLEIKNKKFKIVNVSRLKTFCEPSEKNVCPEDTHLSQGDPSLFQDTNINSPQRPFTRALKKLMDYKNAATMAISMLNDNSDFLYDQYTFTKNYTEYCCDKCYNAFLNMKFCNTNKKSMDLRHLIKKSTGINQPDEDFISALFNLIKNNKYCKTDAIKPQFVL